MRPNLSPRLTAWFAAAAGASGSLWFVDLGERYQTALTGRPSLRSKKRRTRLRKWAIGVIAVDSCASRLLAERD